MSAPTLCTCTLKVYNILGAAYNATTTIAELIAEPRKSAIENSNLIVAAPKRAQSNSSGVCTLALVEGASSGQTTVFRLNYQTNDTFGTVVFDPFIIPNQASLDLATQLTISRG